MNKLRTKKGGMAMSPERAFQLGKTETLNEVMKIIDEYTFQRYEKDRAYVMVKILKQKLLELEGKK